MKETIIKKQIALKCEKCGSTQHTWHEVYYEDKATLKKMNKTYITWCKKSKNYVLLND